MRRDAFVARKNTQGRKKSKHQLLVNATRVIGASTCSINSERKLPCDLTLWIKSVSENTARRLYRLQRHTWRKKLKTHARERESIHYDFLVNATSARGSST